MSGRKSRQSRKPAGFPIGSFENVSAKTKNLVFTFAAGRLIPLNQMFSLAWPFKLYK
jgi:hypothetical protein